MYEGAVQDLIDELGRLPGIGPKSAQRIAFHLLAAEPVDVERLAATLQRVKAEVRFCRICGNVAESEECRICRDPRRDATIICVVEEPKDVVAVERTREFRGRYHVLGGAISPIDGVGPERPAGPGADGAWLQDGTREGADSRHGPPTWKGGHRDLPGQARHADGSSSLPGLARRVAGGR